MKIRMITFHTPKNYGAVLQAFSLMRYLKNFTDDVQIIDYNTPHLRSLYPLIDRPGSIKGVIKTCILLPTFPKKKNKFIRFDEFLKEKLELTERFETTAELYRHPWDADIFVTGSDQVFNPGRIRDERQAFYLDFVPESSKKISYAASFGVSQVPASREAEIKNYLESFDALSVREVSAVDLVKSLSGRSAVPVLDPVFLNDLLFWRGQSRKYEGLPSHYLLYYRLLDNRESDAFVLNYARENGLKTVVIADGFLRMKYDLAVRDAGPQEFLYLFDHADFVVTNAFHGVAFSLIFEKQFVFSDPDAQTNGRGLSLLRMAKIDESAFMKSFCKDTSLDYESIHRELNTYIIRSSNYLKDTVTYERS